MDAPPSGGYAQTHLQLDAQLTAASWSDVERRVVARAHDLARSLFSARFRPCGKTFLAHLIGTASIAVAHAPPTPGDARQATEPSGRRLAVVQAALLHAAYTQGDFGDATLGDTAASRQELREALGEDGEFLVSAYADFSWKPWLSLRDAGGAALTRRLQELDQDGRAVLFLVVCNALEDTLDAAVGHVGEAKARSILRHVTAASELARQLGHQRLADELQAALDAAPAPDPQAPNKSFTVAPRSMRPRRRLRLFGSRPR
jgi:hypothetical protein